MFNHHTAFHALSLERSNQPTHPFSLCPKQPDLRPFGALSPVLPALVAAVGDSCGRAPPHMGRDPTASPRAARRVAAATRGRCSSYRSVVVPLSSLMPSANLCPGFAAEKICFGQVSRAKVAQGTGTSGMALRAPG